ncbi:hypothetical protein R1Y13_13760 [Pseudomonas sp. NY8938]|uniref:hypothetical protein n=1 Tax=Pseudomonas sp. NY8938 TaxID=3081664 RepID=UPI00385756A1
MSYHALAAAFLLLALLAILAIWCFRRSNVPKLTFYSEGSIVFASATISVIVIILFLFFMENEIKVPDGIGQVGDFIGGLTNPILSFAALVVLLRSTSIQTKILEEQHKLYEVETFRSEFYLLLNNIADSSRRHADVEYINSLVKCHREGRVEVLRCLINESENKARDIVVGSIEHGPFERFAISIRQAMEHIVTSEIPDRFRYNYAVMVMDSMTKSQRIVLLNWAYFYWPTARSWLQHHPFARGITADEFICDEVFNFFTAIKKS